MCGKDSGKLVWHSAAGSWLPEAVSAGRAGVPHLEVQNRGDRILTPEESGQRRLHRRKQLNWKPDRESRYQRLAPQLEVLRPPIPYIAPIKAVPFFRKSVIRSVEDAEKFFGTCANIVAKKPS